METKHRNNSLLASTTYESNNQTAQAGVFKSKLSFKSTKIKSFSSTNSLSKMLSSGTSSS
jgi:hypothetical protein